MQNGLFVCCNACRITFGGMCSWSASWRTVARVFALVVRCRVMRLLHYSRVGKNRDTRRESPAGAGAGRTADHLTIRFSQKILAVRKGNDIYRPVSHSYFIISFCKLSIMPSIGSKFQVYLVSPFALRSKI